MTYVEESESFKDSGLKDVLKLHVPQSQRTVAPGPQPEQSQEAQSLNEKTGVLVKAMEKFKDSLDQLAKTLGMARQGLQQAQ